MKKILFTIGFVFFVHDIFSVNTLYVKNESNVPFYVKVCTWGLGPCGLSPSEQFTLGPGESTKRTSTYCWYNVSARVQGASDDRLNGRSGQEDMPSNWRCLPNNKVFIGIHYPPNWVFPVQAGQAATGGATAQQTVVSVGGSAPIADPQVYIDFR
jgi:hypothetical protein